MILLLSRLVSCISAVAAAVLLYQAIVGVFALVRMKRAQPGSKFHRFAIVVAARNEQQVIGQLLDSLNRQNYPHEAFSLFVIADNCTDHTAQVAQANGARVYNRHNLEQIGKGCALNWFFEVFRTAYPNDFDAIAIFDADNLVDPGFLAVMNDRLCAGDQAVMGYRDSKNPYDSWVAAGHSISFWFNSRFYSQSRERLGLSALAGGTGYVFRTELVKSGWLTSTISEDLEFSLQQMALGRRIGYEPRARFYDEQPTSLTTSLRQRQRWAAGCYQNIRTSLPPFCRSVTFQNLPMLLDSILFLFMMPLMAVQMLCVLPQFFAIYLQPAALRPELLFSMLQSGAIGIGLIYVQVILTLLLEKKMSGRILMGTLLFPLFLMTNGLVYLAALAKPRLSWHPIPHQRSVSLEQIERS